MKQSLKEPKKQDENQLDVKDENKFYATKDIRFTDTNDLIFLDIDRPYLIKPREHPIFYRLSASKRGFHVCFKRSWLTKEEMFLLLLQCDHAWLCKCITDGQFRIARTKNGKSATNWRISIHKIKETGKLQSHTKKMFNIKHKLNSKPVTNYFKKLMEENLIV